MVELGRHGGQLPVDGDGNMVGSVSSGGIEGAVAHGAEQAMEAGQPRLIAFGVTNEAAYPVVRASVHSLFMHAASMEIMS